MQSTEAAANKHTGKHTNIHVHICNIRCMQKSRGTDMHASSNTPRQTHTRSVWGYLGQVSMDREEGGWGTKRGDMWERDKVGTDCSTDRGKWATKGKGSRGKKSQAEKE